MSNIAGPQGIKLNPTSAAELGGAVVCGLLALIYIFPAYSNFRIRSNYKYALSAFQSGETGYTQAAKSAKAVIDIDERLYWPYELSAMCLYLQGEVAQAMAAYRDLASRSSLRGSELRSGLPKLALANLELIHLRNEKRSIDSNEYKQAAEEARRQVEALGRTTMLEAPLLLAQLRLDLLADPKTTEAQAEEVLEQVLVQLKDLEKKIVDKRVTVSRWGAAVFYNTLGLVSYRLALRKWTKIGLGEATRTVREQAIWRREHASDFEEASVLSAKAVDSFRAAMLYRTVWDVADRNFEAALSLKLVEDTHKVTFTDEDRLRWLDFAEQYVAERSIYVLYVRTMQRVPEKRFNPDPGKRIYSALLNNLGWGYAILGDYTKSLGWLGRSIGHEMGPATAAYNRLRVSTMMWKPSIGENFALRRDLQELRRQVYELYKHSPAVLVGDSRLRSVRLNNNKGCFFLYEVFTGDVIPLSSLQLAAKTFRDTASDLAKIKSSGEPWLLDQIRADGIDEAVANNRRTVLNWLVNHPEITENERIAVQQELAEVGN